MMSYTLKRKQPMPRRLSPGGEHRVARSLKRLLGAVLRRGRLAVAYFTAIFS